MKLPLAIPCDKTLPHIGDRVDSAPAADGAASRNSAVHLEALTVFRFFAALWAVLFHLQMRVPLGWPELVGHLMTNGVYAMSFFFVLSGTVLAYGYGDLASRPHGVSRFYVARLARLYPVYILGYACALPGLGIAFPGDWPRWVFVNLVSLLGIQAWFPHAFVGANGGLWQSPSSSFSTPCFRHCCRWRRA
jgi:peptidoglycan/LPS O-acetylase OafA/YrhL